VDWGIEAVSDPQAVKLMASTNKIKPVKNNL
jgi:hypothetical protein